MVPQEARQMESSGPEKQSVRVTILSRPYTLIATGDPREIEQVAAKVDELMLSIAAKAPNADSTRIAVLACLHLADTLRRAEQELDELRQRKDSRSGEYAAMLERLISSGEELSA
jgi:cell division protein ZapA